MILEGKFDAFQWGWYVEPDPDSMLELHDLRPARRLVRLVVLQQGVRRALRAADVQTDQAKREAEVKQMQQILYERRRRTWSRRTPTIGEAYRSDRFACFVPQPDPGGVWLDPVRRLQLPPHPAGRPRPATVTASTTRRRAPPRRSATRASASSTGVLIGAGVVVLGCSSVGGVVAMRRRRHRRTTASDRPVDADAGRRPSAEPRREPAAGGAATARYVGAQGARLARQPGLHAGGQLLPVPGAARRPGAQPGPRAVRRPGAARGVQQDLRARPAAARSSS